MKRTEGRTGEARVMWWDRTRSTVSPQLGYPEHHNVFEQSLSYNVITRKVWRFVNCRAGFDLPEFQQEVFPWFCYSWTMSRSPRKAFWAKLLQNFWYVFLSPYHCIEPTVAFILNDTSQPASESAAPPMLFMFAASLSVAWFGFGVGRAISGESTFHPLIITIAWKQSLILSTSAVTALVSARYL